MNPTSPPPSPSPKICGWGPQTTVSLMRKIDQTEKNYKGEIAWRDNEIKNLQDRADLLETVVKQLQNDMVVLKQIIGGQGQAYAQIATGDSGPSAHSSAMDPKAARFKWKDSLNAAAETRPGSVTDATDTTLFTPASTVVNHNSSVRSIPAVPPGLPQPMWMVLGLEPPTAECCHSLPEGVTIPEYFACPKYQFEIPPRPLEKPLTYIFFHSSDPHAIALHEYHSDDRNWPSWVGWTMLRNEGLVKDRRLIRSMLVMQESWKRCHNSPLGEPDGITCGPHCKAKCWQSGWEWREEAGSTWPTMYGWPEWNDAKLWEVVAFSEKKKMEATHPKGGSTTSRPTMPGLCSVKCRSSRIPYLTRFQVRNIVRADFGRLWPRFSASMGIHLSHILDRSFGFRDCV